MTRQTTTALVSAVLLVVLAIALAVAPVPFVTINPGRSVDVLSKSAEGQPLIDLGAVQTYPTTGHLEMTTVAVTRIDGIVGVPEALLTYFLPNRQPLPRDVYYGQDDTAEGVADANSAQMTSSQDAALIAALRSAGESVQEVPMVVSVREGGPAADILEPGDLILAIDGTPIRAEDEVVATISAGTVGDEVSMLVLRGGRETTVQIALGAANDNPSSPVIGIQVGLGYRATPSVQYNIDPEIGGPSAGLVFGLAIYDLITPGDLLGQRRIAGSGTLEPAGEVGGIGGVNEKIAAAERTEADAFLMSSENCEDLQDDSPEIRVVPVATLDDAIIAVEALGDPVAADRLPRC